MGIRKRISRFLGLSKSSQDSDRYPYDQHVSSRVPANTERYRPASTILAAPSRRIDSHPHMSAYTMSTRHMAVARNVGRRSLPATKMPSLRPIPTNVTIPLSGNTRYLVQRHAAGDRTVEQFSSYSGTRRSVAASCGHRSVVSGRSTASSMPAMSSAAAQTNHSGWRPWYVKTGPVCSTISGNPIRRCSGHIACTGIPSTTSVGCQTNTPQSIVEVKVTHQKATQYDPPPLVQYRKTKHQEVDARVASSHYVYGSEHVYEPCKAASETSIGGVTRISQLDFINAKQHLKKHLSFKNQVV